MQTNNNNMMVVPPSLPKGGGTIQGMGESLGSIGPTGELNATLPLPVTAGRSYAPSLNLNYSNHGGNSTFGLGWNIPLLSIRRRTSQGTPQYNENDTFIGPDGEVLVVEMNEQGQPISTTVDSYQGVALGKTYQVSRYFPRIEGGFNRIEYWQSDSEQPFWLIHGADGQLHCLGKSAQARISGTAPTHIAEWLIEESVSPMGEHICYRYLAEDSAELDDNQAAREHEANRYLSLIHYGNKTAESMLFAWHDAIPADDQWLFTLIFDYGERGLDLTTKPSYTATGNWSVRHDPFSDYRYGFEVRTYRLCRQVLMFHRFAELGEGATLVSRLMLEYDDNAVVSLLTGARLLAYSDDDKAVSIPPLDLSYSAFSPVTASDQWQDFIQSPGLSDGNYYQFVDLYGDGLSGVLYKSGNDWRYCSPERDQTSNDPNAITYSDWRLLPNIPAQQNAGMLMDVDGDGYLDWLVVDGIRGRYSMTPERQWTSFIPLNALPNEFTHPDATLADIVGSGMSDLALIGPKSVRFYAAERGSGDFATAIDVAQDSNITLPFNRIDERELVAFSDVLGSGQQHIVRVRYDAVTCWPNLGRGKFAEPITLSGFAVDEADFDPMRVYLADLDGSGAVDIIYAEHDKLRIFQNQSGNSFKELPALALPVGVYFDHLCHLNIADMQGLGVASIVLSVEYMAPRRWVIHLTNEKPYLLNAMNNNMGANRTFNYRSSAQFWLDEKRDNPQAINYLPFPVHTISAVYTEDEISGNRLSQTYRYWHGVYDPKENEFRGFGLVDARDTDENAEGNTDLLSAPSLIRSWYHTGLQGDETRATQEKWADDESALTLKSARLTTLNTTTGLDELLTDADETDNYWFYRSLKGMPLYSEVYGEDGLSTSPYQVTSYRYLVRSLVRNKAANAFVTMPLMQEQLNYGYERIKTDPQCAQQLQLRFDEYGVTTHAVTINYPRRLKTSSNPYPDTLPETSWASSYDDQQNVLRLSESLQNVYHLTDFQNWRLGLPHQSRNNMLIYERDRIPTEGFSVEALLDSGGLLADDAVRIYAGQVDVIYQGESQPDIKGLVYYIRQAELDETALQAYDGIISSEELTGKLTNAGYVSTARLLGKENEANVWAIESGFTTYSGAETFYRPLKQQATRLTGEQEITWDSNACVVVSIKDALDNTSRLEYDYRFLQPVKSTDINDNVSQVVLDPLGRVLYSRSWGTENGNDVGFTPDHTFIAPTNVEEVLALSAPLPVASASVVNNESWMGNIRQEQLSRLAPDTDALWSTLVANRIITPEGFIRSRVKDKLAKQSALPAGVAEVLASAEKIPPHAAVVSADRYPDDSEQQVRASVVFSDGFGRLLQTSGRVVAGSAYVRQEDGSLKLDGNNKPIVEEAMTRWAISGRVEYDNKGQAIRQFRPYFLNDWRYTNNQSANTNLYADTHFYDPLGRITKVVTAKGYERRAAFYPWFSVSEDENDTAE